MQKRTSQPRSVTLLVYMALFTALNVIFTRVLAFDLGPYRIAFGPVATIMAGLWLGPVCGGLCGFMADVLGCFIQGYPPNPLITVTAILWGVIPGLVRKMLPGLDRKRRTAAITLSIAVSGLIGSIGFTTAGLVLLLGYNFYVIFPGRVVQTILMAIMISGGQSSLWGGILASGISITVVYIPQYFRTIRAEVIRIKDSAYVESAKVVGASTWRIMTKHLLKNSTRTLPVILTLNSSEAILTLAGLGFLGFGIEPTAAAEWGYDLNRSVADVTAGIWWTAVFPGLAIVLIVLGITLIGESLNDLADPRLRARKSAGEVVGSIEDTSVDPTERPNSDEPVVEEFMTSQDPQIAVVSRDVPDESRGVINDD